MNKKIDGFIQDMSRRRVSRYLSAPPLYRLLWRFRADIRPPLFQSFLVNALTTGTLFGVLVGIPIWLFASFLLQSLLPIGSFLANSLLVGLLFGLIIATSYSWKAKSLGLPKWESYVPPERE